MNFSENSRRDFLRIAALGAAGLAMPAVSSGRSKTPRDSSSVRLGVASYSLRELDREKAIAAIQEIGTPYVSIKSFHLPYESTPEELDAGCRAFEKAGLQIVGGGVIYLQKEDDDDIRFHFEYAKSIKETANRPEHICTRMQTL